MTADADDFRLVHPNSVVIADEPEVRGHYASLPRTVNAEQRTAMITARAAGRTLRQIADDLGCSHVTVANIIDAEQAA